MYVNILTKLLRQIFTVDSIRKQGKDMIRIFMIGYSKKKGGVETFISYLHNNLCKEKFEIYFASPKMVIDGKTWVTPKNRHRYISYRLFWHRFFKENRFDVIYYNTCDIVSIDMLRFAKKAKIPVRIIHSHNSGNQMSINKKPDIVHSLSEKHNKKVLHKYATHFFACSDVAGKWMFGDRDFKVIKNGISLEKYKYQDENVEKLKSEYHLSDCVVGCVGSLSPQKNPFFAIDIFKSIISKHPLAHLVLIGDGELRQSLEQKVNHLGLEKNIHFVGAVDNVNEWMSAIDCLLMPSLFEGLPFALVEAQAAGLPCVVSSNVSEEANITGLVDFVSLDESTDVWADKILEKIGQARPDTTKQLVDAGYSIEDTAREVSEIIEKAL